MKSDDPEDAPDLAVEFESLLTCSGQRPDARIFLLRYPGASHRERLDVLLLDQTRTIRAGHLKRAEIYLNEYPELFADRDSKLDLVYNEFRVLCETGAAPDPGQYAIRFPELEESLSRQIEVGRWLATTIQDPSWYPRLNADIADVEALDPQPPALEPLAPLSPDDFELGPELGKGGMGTVYKAYQKSLDRDVAVKALKPSDGLDRRVLERFIAEAKILGRLRNPHIVGIHGIGRFADGSYFLVMELIAGTDLGRVLEQAPLEPSISAKLVGQVAEGLHHAHQSGVIHRDLKPSNVLIGSDGRAIVTDFGLAKRFEANDPALTRVGEIMGTPHYMAPEQADSRWGAVGPLTDVYGLGALLYASLSGRPPFEGITTLEVLTRVCSTDPPAPLPSCVPGRVREICERCLSKAPAGRFASARDVAEALREYLRLADGAAGSDRKSAQSPGKEIDPPTVAAVPAPTAERGWLATYFPSWPLTAALGVLGLILALSLTLPSSRDMLGGITRPVGSNRSSPDVVSTSPAAPSTEDPAPAHASPPPTPQSSPGTVAPAESQSTRVARSAPTKAEPPPKAAPQPAQVQWTILRGRDNRVRSLILEEDSLRSGDAIRLSCQFSRPSFAYLFWIDSEGDVQRIFPHDQVGWSRPSAEIQWPSEDPLDAVEIKGPPGTEVLLLVVLDEPSKVPMVTEFERAIKPDQPLRERARNPVLVDGLPPQAGQRGTGSRTTLVEIPASLERLWRTAKSSVIKIHPRAEAHVVALSHEPANGHRGGS
jgi:serine/threonine protein kinase